MCESIKLDKEEVDAEMLDQEWDEDDLDVQGGLEILPEPGYEAVAVVGAGRSGQAMPGHPAMEEGMTTGL